MAGRADFLVDLQAALQLRRDRYLPKGPANDHFSRRRLRRHGRSARGVRAALPSSSRAATTIAIMPGDRRALSPDFAQHVVGDRVRHRTRLLDPAEQRQHDQEVGEVAERSGRGRR